VPCAGTRKPRRGSQAKRGESAVEQEVDDAEYADQNEDSSNVPTAEPRDQKNGKGRRCGIALRLVKARAYIV